MKPLEVLLEEANAESVNVYLARQQNELQIQGLNIQRQQLDMQLLRLDGRIEFIKSLLAPLPASRNQPRSINPSDRSEGDLSG